MSVDGVRPVKVAGAPFIEVVYRRWVHPSLILTRHHIVARIGSQLHHPTFLNACSRSYTAAHAYSARTALGARARPSRGRLASHIVYLQLLHRNKSGRN